jgi:serine/threonine protein phosphatase 1
MATVAVGDVHGEAAALAGLLRQIDPVAGHGDTVVFLGDYIDRGSASKECIDRLLEFRQSTDAGVVFLRGNHEDCLLRTMRDYRQHSWLLSMEGLATIRSYSVGAADAVVAAMADLGIELFVGDVPLPYELFFAALPDDHRRFLEELRSSCETVDCLCSHAGLDPAVEWARQTEQALLWGHVDFPDAYRGDTPLVYGHWNNAVIDEKGHPGPRILGNTIGIDTIAHGVLTAIRLPARDVLQHAASSLRPDETRPGD